MMLHRYPANIYQSEAKNKNTKISCKICAKLTLKISQRSHSDFFIVNLKHTSHFLTAFGRDIFLLGIT